MPEQVAWKRTMDGRLLIFSGNANPALAREIAATLRMTLGRAMVGEFKNGETRIKIHDNVRGCDIFIIQPTCTPVDHNLMELLLMIDAVRRASARRVTAVIPYYGYAKQEKKNRRARANLGKTGGQFDPHRRRRPGADDGSPRAGDRRLL